MRSGWRLRGRWSMNQACLLMDEPFGNIDAQTRIDLQRELLELWEQHGRP